MFDARKGQITITRGDTGLLAIVPTGYVPTSQDRMFFMVAEMPDGRIVINKTVTPDDDGVCKLMFSGTDTENLSKRHREYTYAIRFALDVTESNGKITGYREMITPEPPGCFVVLEANGCPACTCETQNVGSMEVKLESFRGPKGDRGEKGDKGDRGAKGEPGKDAVIDATLTQEGEAADAATTGKRLAEIEKAVAEKADKARQNILIGSETGNLVSVSDAFSAPLCGLTVYGKSTQDGTPSPDNPAPIVSAGDGGTITVTIGDGADERQTITLPTPNGLPGIPVTSGGNYTDSTGQQWVCDEINLERGVRVQRIASFVINAKNANNIFVTNEYTHVTVAVNARLATPQKTNRDIRFERCVFCEALPWSANAWASTVNCAGFVENDSVDLTIENSYLGTTEASTYDERKAALVKCFTNNPCRVVYRIATPIETLLTPDEIAAYKAITVYGPDTVVQAGDGAGIRLAYQRDVNIVVKNLEDAIASMTTT